MSATPRCCGATRRRGGRPTSPCWRPPTCWTGCSATTTPRSGWRATSASPACTGCRGCDGPSCGRRWDVEDARSLPTRRTAIPAPCALSQTQKPDRDDGQLLRPRLLAIRPGAHAGGGRPRRAVAAAGGGGSLLRRPDHGPSAAYLDPCAPELHRGAGRADRPQARRPHGTGGGARRDGGPGARRRAGHRRRRRLGPGGDPRSAIRPAPTWSRRSSTSKASRRCRSTASRTTSGRTAGGTSPSTCRAAARRSSGWTSTRPPRSAGGC